MLLHGGSDLVSSLHDTVRGGQALKLVIFGAFALWIPRLSARVSASAAVRHRAYMALGLAALMPVHIALGAEAQNVWSVPILLRDAPACEVSAVDLLAVLLHASHLRRGIATRFPRPLLVPCLFYLLAMLASVWQSPCATESLFSVIKLLRLYYVFAVVATGFHELDAVRACLSGMAVGLALQAPIVLFQKYVAGSERPEGTLGHSNTAAMVANLVTPVAASLLLSKRATPSAYLMIAGTALCELLGQSRAGLVYGGLGIALAMALSLARDFTAQKLRRLACFAAVMAVPAAIYVPTTLARFEKARDLPWITRLHLLEAARRMIADHPWGVGANMYTWVMNQDGYALPAGIMGDARAWPVHNSYYLIAGELGWFGLAAFALLLVTALATAGRSAWVRGLRGDIGSGAVAGILCYLLHNWTEPGAIGRAAGYVFWIVVAMALGMRAFGRGQPGATSGT
jgi:hypothetical protein